ncbi:MAG TPA: DUF3788 family protein [Terriglobales bacterium]|nr:DUF3788 family protein [Terriglobales bacterium]
MQANAFVGKKEKPTESELANALGTAKKLWSDAVKALAEVAPDQEWHSYSIKAGWALKLKMKERVIVYLSPRKGSFLASFALGDKAVKAALQSPLSEEELKLIKEAKKYAEGTAVRIEVHEARDVAVVKTIATIKAAN